MHIIGQLKAEEVGTVHQKDHDDSQTAHNAEWIEQCKECACENLVAVNRHAADDIGKDHTQQKGCQKTAEAN